jgi:protein TonB
MSVPAAPQQANPTQRLVFPRPGALTDENAPPMITGLRFGPGGNGVTGILDLPGTGNAPSITVIKPKDTGPTRVSIGVTNGLLLAPIQPVYPPIARAAGIQGTVVLEAVISKAGRIESLHAISGPEMLRKAAMDAVAVARYRPYLLNGDPTEVQTTVTVVFRLGS